MVTLIEWIDGNALLRGSVKKADKSKIQVTALTGKSLSLRASRFHIRHEVGGEADEFFRSIDGEAAEVEAELLHGEVEPGSLLQLKELAAAWFDRASPSAREISILLTACLKGAPWFKVDSSGRVRAAVYEEIERWQREREARRRDEAERERIDAVLSRGRASDEERANDEEKGDDDLSTRIGDAFLALLLEGKRLDDWKPAAAAVRDAARDAGLTVDGFVRRHLAETGNLPSAYRVHMEQFRRVFDRTAEASPQQPEPGGDIYPEAPEAELAQIEADVAGQIAAFPPTRNGFIFSVDDEMTTEIDDAISVEAIDEERFRLGVHIAAPGIFVAEESRVHALAVSRLTTVYQPDLKWTMLPLEIIDLFSLKAGRTVPAVSAYYTVEKESLEIVDVAVRLEAVTLDANLSYQAIEAGLEGGFLPDLEKIGEDPGLVMAWLERDARDFPWARTAALPDRLDAAVDLLVPLARKLYLDRRLAGDRPFYRLEHKITVSAEGDVSISERRRNSLAEGIVSELMILTNSRMARILADAELPAVYRTQQIIGGGGAPAAGTGPGATEGDAAAAAPVLRRKAELTVNPREHAGLGASFYSWTTSPLRRYSDLINQRQLGSLIDGRLPAFSDASELLVRAKKMEFQNKTADSHQKRMERYFTMKYMEARLGEAWPVFVEYQRRGTRLFFDKIPFSTTPSPDDPLPPEGPAFFTPELFDFYELTVNGATGS
jgi:exoribonuclease II